MGLEETHQSPQSRRTKRLAPQHLESFKKSPGESREQRSKESGKRTISGSLRSGLQAQRRRSGWEHSAHRRRLRVLMMPGFSTTTNARLPTTSQTLLHCFQQSMKGRRRSASNLWRRRQREMHRERGHRVSHQSSHLQSKSRRHPPALLPADGFLILTREGSRRIASKGGKPFLHPFHLYIFSAICVVHGRRQPSHGPLRQQRLSRTRLITLTSGEHLYASV